MKKHIITTLALVAALVLAACQVKVEESSSTSPTTAAEKSAGAAEKAEPAKPAEPAEPAKPAAKSYAPSPKPAGWKAPNRIKVQHILIGVKGAPLPKPDLPTEEEARKLARELCDRIRAGEDMDALVKQYTHDSHPGIYTMIETGQPDMQNLVFPRAGMAKAFGDVSYSLDVGECAIADYDKQPNPRQSTSPFGFHVIKRLE